MDFKHKKKYGQNFLNNKDEILNKIIEVSNIDENDEILEIGPGQGALTNLLVERAKKLTCIEIDKDLEAGLRKKFSSKENYTLVMGDVLEVDLTKYLNKGTKVVANIPYYITSPIINKLIENKELIDEAYIMVQKEVGERICAKAGKERSILTLAVEYYGEADYLFTIPREFFNPIPNVDSAFISIKFYKDDRYKNKISEDLFFKYIKAAFSNKRKNIVNNLATLGYSKDKIKEILNQVEISENERAENISMLMKKSYEFLIQSKKEDIDFINKIVEAYEGAGVVRTLDSTKGIISVISTDDYKDVMREVLIDLGNRWVDLKIIEEGAWKGTL